MHAPHGPNSNEHFTVRNARAEIDFVEEHVLNALQKHGFPEASKFAVRLAMEEAIVNAFHHGHKNLPAELPVKVDYSIDGKKLLITVSDQGPGFDPETVPDCTADENIERTSGRGLMLIRSFMSSVRHENRGSRLVMEYTKPTA